jgi:hypothetical protein
MKGLAPTATAKDVIYAYLKRKLLIGDNEISSHHFETELVKYGELYWGVTKLPSAYSRAWRDIRQKEEYINHDITSVEKIDTESAEATWKIVRNS